MGELEVADLEHNREHLAEVNDAERQKEYRHIDRERERAHDAAEEERACVAHEYLRGVEVPYQKSEAGSRDSRAYGGDAERVELACDKHEADSDEEGDRAVETVYAVGEVDRVNYADDHDCRDDIIEESEVDRADEGNDR